MDENIAKQAAEHPMDMPQEQETSAALREARELLESARNAKRRFMANMSHEIRTPLNAIWGLLDLMLADEATPPAQLELLASARRSAELLVNLTSDILDFTVIDKGTVKFESTGFSLRSIISAVIARQHDLTQNKAVSIHSHVNDDVPDNLLGDSGRLYQILKHLVGNGIKFTPAGEVAVEVRRWPASGPVVNDREVELHFSIRDTGVGIAKEKLAHIFESLTQGDESSTRAFGGLGIGLNIVQRLVVLLDGRIWIQSAPGQGTTVHFLLPFRNTANGDKVAPGPPPKAAYIPSESPAQPGWMLNPSLPEEFTRPEDEGPRAAAGTAPLPAQWWQLYRRLQEILYTGPQEAEVLLKSLRIEAGGSGYSDLSTVLFRLLLAVRRKDPSEIEQYHALLQRTVPPCPCAAGTGAPRRSS
jgi:nitrogen-specific signal transduction histidine kinase